MTARPLWATALSAALMIFRRLVFTSHTLRASVCLSLEAAEAIGFCRARSFISHLASAIDPHLLHCVCPLNSQSGCNKLRGCCWYLPAINQSLLPSSLATLDSSADCTQSSNRNFNQSYIYSCFCLPLRDPVSLLHQLFRWPNIWRSQLFF